MSYISTFSALSKNGYQGLGISGWNTVQEFTTTNPYGYYTPVFNSTGEYLAFTTMMVLAQVQFTYITIIMCLTIIVHGACRLH